MNKEDTKLYNKLVKHFRLNRRNRELKPEEEEFFKSVLRVRNECCNN